MELPQVPGGFGGIVADPPWLYKGDPLNDPPYPCLPFATLLGMRVREIAAKNSLLFLWCTEAFLEWAPLLIRTWGFEPKTRLIWAKGRLAPAPEPDKIRVDPSGRVVAQIGTGVYLRHAHETLIVAARNQTPLNRSVPSFILAKKRGHSVKPDRVLEIVETMAPGPYVEIFARRTRPGWVPFGNQLPKTAEEKQEELRQAMQEALLEMEEETVPRTNSQVMREMWSPEVC